MSKSIQEKALLATQYKIERLQRESGFFKRNTWKTIVAGAVISVLGPLYVSNNEFGRRQQALEVSELSHLELTLVVAICYSIAITVAHFVWTGQEKRKLQALLKRKRELENELEINS